MIDPLDESAFRPDDPESYLRRLDGLAYGMDPRTGYTEGNRFFHPQMRFQCFFPEGWTINNQKSSVIASSPDRRAAIDITPCEHRDMEPAVRGFFLPSRSNVSISDLMSWPDAAI